MERSRPYRRSGDLCVRISNLKTDFVEAKGVTSWGQTVSKAREDITNSMFDELFWPRIPESGFVKYREKNLRAKKSGRHKTIRSQKRSA